MARKQADAEREFAGAIRKKLGMPEPRDADAVWSDIAGGLGDALESLESLSETVDEMAAGDEEEAIAGDLAGIERNLESVQASMDQLEKLTGLGQGKTK